MNVVACRLTTKIQKDNREEFDDVLIEYQNSQIVPSCKITVKPWDRARLFTISDGLSVSWQLRNIKQLRIRHTLKHPHHKSVKRAEVDQGVDDVDEVPASSCLARVPTYSKATQFSVQHALTVMLKCMNSSFRCRARGAESRGSNAKIHTHTSKLAKPLNMQWCS